MSDQLLLNSPKSPSVNRKDYGGIAFESGTDTPSQNQDRYSDMIIDIDLNRIME